MASFTSSIYDVIAALLAAETPEFLGTNRRWRSINPDQRFFLEELLEQVKPLTSLLEAERILQAQASWEASVINDWFRDRGFSILLEDFGQPDVFYTGSIFELLVRWLEPGEKKMLLAQDGREYPGVLTEGFTYFISASSRNVVAQLPTQSGEVVYLAPFEYEPTGPFAPLMLAQLIMDVGGWKEEEYDKLFFPMIDLNHLGDLGWLEGLWTFSESGEKATLIKAVQQSVLKVNEVGALAKSAAGMAVVLESFVSERLLTINRPFLFWIVRKDFPLPLFAAWVDVDSWKDPGSLK